MKDEKVYKYEVTTIGPGSSGGSRFTSITEALRFARHLLQGGTECKILIL